MYDRRRPRGAWLYAEGEAAEKVFYVKQGTVVLSREADPRRGRAVAWAVRRAGALLGMEALVRPAYLDSARAATGVTLCAASRDAMEAWLAARSEGARALLERVLITLALDAPRRPGAEGSALERVARWLLDAPEGAEDVPRAVQAELLGMQPETFSRALAELAARGAIATTRRSIRVVDAAALGEAAGLGADTSAE